MITALQNSTRGTARSGNDPTKEYQDPTAHSFLAPWGNKYIVTENPARQVAYARSPHLNASQFPFIVNRDTFRMFNNDGLSIFSKPLDPLLQGKASNKDHTVNRSELEVAVDVGVPNVMDLIRSNLGRTKMRGQKQPDGATVRWENDANYFFNYGMFPVTIKTVVNKQVYHRMGTFVVVYSSFPPLHSKQANAGLLVDAPNWTKVYLDANEKGVSEQPFVHVDKNIVGDVSFAASLTAALENTNPVNGSYISFFPYAPDSEFSNGIYATPSNKQIRGASCGLAVCLAILGCAPFYSTGYIKHILHGTVLPGNAATKMVARAKEDYMMYPRVTTEEGVEFDARVYITDRDGNRKDVDPLVKIPMQFNFVENVDAIVYKMGMCSAAGAPFLFPVQSDMNLNMAQFLHVARNKEKMVGWLNMMPEIYDLSKANDGKPMVVRNGNNAVMYTNAVGATIDDMTTLSALQLYSMFFINQVNTNLATGAVNMRWSSEFYEGLNDWAKNEEKDRGIVSARMALLRRKIDEAKEQASTEGEFQDAATILRSQYKEHVDQIKADKKKPGLERKAKIARASVIRKNAKASGKKELADLKRKANFLKLSKQEKKRFRLVNGDIYTTIRKLNESVRNQVLAVVQPIMYHLAAMSKKGLSHAWIYGLAGRYNNVIKTLIRFKVDPTDAKAIADSLGFRDLAYWQARLAKQQKEGTADPEPQGNQSQDGAAQSQLPQFTVSRPQTTPKVTTAAKQRRPESMPAESYAPEFLTANNPYSGQSSAPEDDYEFDFNDPSLYPNTNVQTRAPSQAQPFQGNLNDDDAGNGKTSSSGAGLFKTIGSGVGSVLDTIF